MALWQQIWPVRFAFIKKFEFQLFAHYALFSSFLFVETQLDSTMVQNKTSTYIFCFRFWGIYSDISQNIKNSG